LEEPSDKSQQDETSEKPKEKTPTLLLFGRYDQPQTDSLDRGLLSIVKLKPCYMPHSAGRHAHRPFRKLELNVVERMANLLALTKKAGGKKAKGLAIMRKSLSAIEGTTKQNPLSILLKAVQNSAPREDTTKISYGGVSYFQSVDISPSRRLDVAMRNLVNGARQKSYKNPITIEKALAEEIVAASNNDPKCFAISRREELERHAQSSR